MNKNISINFLGYDELLEEEKETASDNGNGKKDALYLKVVYPNGETTLKSDAMCREDATFSRDLNWIKSELEKCFLAGKESQIKEKQNPINIRACDNCLLGIDKLCSKKDICDNQNDFPFFKPLPF